MKVRTVIISMLVTCSLIAGVVYAAYYSMTGRVTPVEVVPVSNVNVNSGFFGTMDSVYGTVTSQVSQNVMLKDEYTIDEIYVSIGDEVQEGDPLFSYDMTLPELELEMEKLNLQIQELNLQKLEKELAKLQNTTATASLEAVGTSLSFSSGEEILDAAGEATESTQTENTADGQQGEENGGLQIDGIETVETPADDREEEEQTLLLKEGVLRFEQLILAIDGLFQEYGDELEPGDVEEALMQARDYYRKNLADASDVKGTAADGSMADAKAYALKPALTAVLSGTEIRTLETYTALMNRCLAAYVDLLILETDGRTGAALTEAVKAAEDAYNDLDPETRKLVKETELLLASLKQAGLGTAPSQSESQDTTPGQSGSLEPGSDTQTEPGTESGSGEQPESGTGMESETQTESSTETGSGEQTESGAETGSETQTESGTETGSGEQPESGTGTGSETQTESGTESGSEAQTESGTESGSEEQTESGTESGSEEQTESDTETSSEGQTESESESETQEDMSVPARIQTFLTLTDSLLSETASPKAEEYRAAIDFYQMYLAVIEPEVAGESAQTTMQKYILSEETAAYLSGLGTEGTQLGQELASVYQKVCMAYVRFMVTGLTPDTITREAWTAASEAYDQLGRSWQAILEEQFQRDQAKAGTQQTEAESGLSESGQTELTDQSALTASYPSLLDYLTAYDIGLQIQELDQSLPQEELITALTALREAYLSLTEVQQTLVWNADVLISLLQQYGLWEEETEMGTDFWDDGGYGLDDGLSMTAEELQLQIQVTKQQITSVELEIRQYELNVEQKQREVDGKTVRSTLNGTVVSVGTADGSSDDEYFVKVTSQVGLYARGVINELALEQIQPGDIISGTSENGMVFTAVIKEVSDYPDPDGSSMSSGSGTENTNASYYPFTALIDDPEGIDEGYAELQFSADISDVSSVIWLEKYFIRTDNAGKDYVYVQGEDGLLEKRIVTTGKTYYDYAIEILAGLDESDRIAFPYGSSVKEGAQTKEVDMLEAAYG